MQNQQQLMLIGQVNGLKPHLGPLFGPKWPILGPANFFQHFDQDQVLDLVILDHNTQIRQKLKHVEQDKGPKPHFGPFWP